MGYLQPGGTADAPALDLQVASSHLRADGAPQLGTLQAFLPAAGLEQIYAMTPEAASTRLAADRRGDPGTSDAPAFAVRSEDATWNAGLEVTVSGITFSAPTYRISARPTAAPIVPSVINPVVTGGGQPAAQPAAGASAGASAPAVAAPVASQFQVTSASRKKGLTVQITGATPGKAKAKLLVKTKTVLTGSVTVAANGTATLRLPVSKSAARKLRKVRSARLRVTLPGEAPRTIDVKLS